VPVPVEKRKGIAASPLTSAEQEGDERYILPNRPGHVKAR